MWERSPGAFKKKLYQHGKLINSNTYDILAAAVLAWRVEHELRVSVHPAEPVVATQKQAAELASLQVVEEHMIQRREALVAGYPAALPALQDRTSQEAASLLHMGQTCLLDQIVAWVGHVAEKVHRDPAEVLD